MTAPKRAKKPKEKKHYCLMCRKYVMESELAELGDDPDVDDWIRIATDVFPQGCCPKCGKPCYPGRPPSMPGRIRAERDAPTFSTLLGYALLDKEAIRGRVLRIITEPGGYGRTYYEMVKDTHSDGGPPWDAEPMRPQVPELERKWKVRNTGEWRENPETEQPNDVFVACPKVEYAVQHDPRVIPMAELVEQLEPERKQILDALHAHNERIREARAAVYQKVHDLYGPEWEDEWVTPPELAKKFKKTKNSKRTRRQ